MLPMILTGLAGLVLGLVIMRIFQSTRPPLTPVREDTDSDAADAASPPAPAPEAMGGLVARLRGLSLNQLVLGGAMVLATIALIVLLQRNQATDASGDAAPQAAASFTGSAGGTAGQLDDVDTMIARLEARLQQNPNDGEGFRMLGWSYQNTGRPDKAAPVYEKAVSLLPDRSDVRVGYGEALVAVAGDVVTPEARDQFRKALEIDRADPRAKFFIALHKAQHGAEQAALDEWIALANGPAQGLPWQADLRQRIGKLAAKLGVDISGRLAAPAAGSASEPMASSPSPLATGATDQRAMINGMVEGLAARLAANPDNAEGWGRLIRSRIVQGDRAKAKSDLAAARKAFAGKPEGLAKINAIATEAGL